MATKKEDPRRKRKKQTGERFCPLVVSAVASLARSLPGLLNPLHLLALFYYAPWRLKLSRLPIRAGTKKEMGEERR